MKPGPKPKVSPAHEAFVRLWLASGVSLKAALAKARINRRTWYRHLRRATS